MDKLGEILSEDRRARLIPSVADPRREERIVSILLSTLVIVRPFAIRLLGNCAVRLGRTSELHGYTEIEFPTADGSSKDRPDGILRVSTRGKLWTALLEAKIDNTDIEKEQIHRYAEIARNHGVDAVITLSNQLVPLPTHIPYAIPARFKNRVSFFHISWTNILTQASLILEDKARLSSLEDWKRLNTEQAYILEEMVRYFKHPKSGVKRFDYMNPEWRSLVIGVRNEQNFSRSSVEIENAVASWHQEEQDLCLLLSRRIGERVEIRLPRKYAADPALRFKEACNMLAISQELQSKFVVPNAASDLEVKANLQRRTISCSMRLVAPGNRKRASGRINWLLRQLQNVDREDAYIRAFWSGRTPTQAPLAEVQADIKTLEIGRLGAVPSGFEVVIIRDLAGRFSGRRTFIESLEQLVPEYYERIGQHLRRWVPPPPPIEDRDPIEGSDAVAKI